MIWFGIICILAGLFCDSGSSWILSTLASIGLIIGGGWLVLKGIGFKIQDENFKQKRHENDYGTIECPNCGSTDVYWMTWDDKKNSVLFYGVGSSKFGKHYHCDSCGKEW